MKSYLLSFGSFLCFHPNEPWVDFLQTNKLRFGSLCSRLSCLAMPYVLVLAPFLKKKCCPCRVICWSAREALTTKFHMFSALGVMNQKMPYFGLHDANHLVALSRNRMYVNLMNLDSGDLVTTFKAGEDRFLNSLLVSGDGR